MLMLDGFRPDYLTIYAPPNLQRLVREGTWVAEARSVFPSTTTTNQTSFVTGSLPASTGIPNNARYDRSADRILKKLRDNRCPTIAEVLQGRGWTTVTVNHFMLEGRGVDQYLQGDIDTVIGLFESEPPGLAVYYHTHTDSVGHSSGPFSPEMREAVLAIDDGIGRLLSKIEAKGLADRTILLVASDHGMVPNDGAPAKPDWEQVIRDLSLRIAFDEAQIQPDTELVCLHFGSAFLYWREGMRTPEREAEVLAALRKMDGVDVLLADDLVALGADPDRLGDIVVVPKEGRLLRKGSGRGGFHGPPFAGRSTMLFWGSGVRRGYVTHRARIVDIVPTLLAWAGIEIPASVDGVVLADIFEAQPVDAAREIAAAGESAPEAAVLAGAGAPAAADRAPGVLAGTPPAGTAHEAGRDPGTTAAPALAAPPVTVERTGHEVVRFTLDCGATRRVKAVRVDAAKSAAPVGPKLYALELSADGVHYAEAACGVLRPLAGGESEWIKFETPVPARYVRLAAFTGYDSRIDIAGLAVTSDGED